MGIVFWVLRPPCGRGEGGHWEPITKYQNSYDMWSPVNMVYKQFDNISIAEIAWCHLR
jgi:hypothetical protein